MPRLSRRVSTALLPRGVARSLTSATGPVAPPVVVSPPVVSPPGPVPDGTLLTRVNAVFTGEDSVSRDWHVDDVPTGLGNGPTFDTTGLAGQSVKFVEVATNAGGSTASESNVVLVEVSDFRFAIPGVQASFRRLEGDVNVVTADGGTTIQTLADAIPQANKTVPETPYLVSAPSAPQRPALGADGAMDFASVNNTALKQLGSHLADLFHNAAPFALYVVGDRDLAPNACYFSVGIENSSSRYNRLSSSNPGTAGIVGQMYTGDWVVVPASTDLQVYAWSFAGGASGIATLYTDSGSESLAMSNVGNALLDQVAIGAWARSPDTSFFTGRIFEVFSCATHHDAPTVASTRAQLKSYWESRGVVFP